MLLALVTAQHSQTLANLDTRFMQELPDKIVFTIRGTLKTTRPGKHLAPIEMLAFSQDPNLPSRPHQKLHYQNPNTSPVYSIIN